MSDTKKPLIRRFNSDANNTMCCINSLRDFLHQENYNCQMIPMADGGIMMKIDKKSGLIKLLGNGIGIDIIFKQEDENTMLVQIGNGRWIDKATIGTMGLLVFPPFAAMAIIGAVRQSKMADYVLDFIDKFITFSKNGSPLGNCLVQPES